MKYFPFVLPFLVFLKYEISLPYCSCILCNAQFLCTLVWALAVIIPIFSGNGFYLPENAKKAIIWHYLILDCGFAKKKKKSKATMLSNYLLYISFMIFWWRFTVEVFQITLISQCEIWKQLPVPVLCWENGQEKKDF